MRMKQIGNKRAYSFVELVVVMVIVGLILLFGTRSGFEQLNRERSKQTIRELGAIRDAIIGDETLVELGDRSDMGYWGANADWPRTTSSANFVADLRPFLNAAIAANIGTDSWGNAYVFTNNAATFQVMSRGADNAVGGTDTNTDIAITFRKPDWEQNSVFIYVHDAKGTLLMPVFTSGDGQSGHIAGVTFTQNGGATYTWNSVTNTLARQNNGFSLRDIIRAGPCTVSVDIANGTGGSPYQGDYNWELELDQPALQNFIVYPKHSRRFNVFIVKTVGAALSGFNEV